ncbi:disease resistance protein RUN1-like isoform X2 [Argentina anserina]|uniref:disease resistance protein RUN1-like isoform X2 n=1 Tax=Argentina anserina TaxID=57926 RepID=UPI002176290F|nr:disease resistance protein RUN1-like isoform X2 [Potentilla anserina]
MNSRMLTILLPILFLTFLLLLFLLLLLHRRTRRTRSSDLDSGDIHISIQSSPSTLNLESEVFPAVHSTNTHIQSSSSSSSSSSEFDHDVFLSFRGDDTRKSFTDHLYYALNKKGINTFRDAEILIKGEAIKQRLEKAIERSKFAVVILSKHYADSKWCLDELAHIIKCKEEKELKVYPVFYDVEPSEVRNQTGKFGDAFARHAANLERTRKLENWRSALKKIAGLAGWDLCGR